jgi:hypothetical protein
VSAAPTIAGANNRELFWLFGADQVIRRCFKVVKHVPLLVQQARFVPEWTEGTTTILCLVSYWVIVISIAASALVH